MTTEEVGITNKLAEKEIRAQIEQQLETALIGWKDELGEKKFKRRIKKAGKAFGKKLAAAADKKAEPAKARVPKHLRKALSK